MTPGVLPVNEVVIVFPVPRSSVIGRIDIDTVDLGLVTEKEKL
jgi:predicted transcriptional regulator